MKKYALISLAALLISGLAGVGCGGGSAANTSAGGNGQVMITFPDTRVVPTGTQSFTAFLTTRSIDDFSEGLAPQAGDIICTSQTGQFVGLGKSASISAPAGDYTLIAQAFRHDTSGSGSGNLANATASARQQVTVTAGGSSSVQLKLEPTTDAYRIIIDGTDVYYVVPDTHSSSLVYHNVSGNLVSVSGITATNGTSFQVQAQATLLNETGNVPSLTNANSIFVDSGAVDITVASHLSAGAVSTNSSTGEMSFTVNPTSTGSSNITIDYAEGSGTNSSEDFFILPVTINP